jgi:pyruvate/2-oxoglutarate/acetoin dehydrogenase E1 component
MQATLLEAINDALHFAMETDDRVVVYGEDVAQQGGVFRATDGLEAEYGAERVVDTPIAEIAIAGSAIGSVVSYLRGRTARVSQRAISPRTAPCRGPGRDPPR